MKTKTVSLVKVKFFCNIEGHHAVYIFDQIIRKSGRIYS